MKKETFDFLENYMLSCMADSAHDKEHIYRVLYTALAIAETEENVEQDILICACLLHDIGRAEQFADSNLDHAAVGAEKAYHFLTEHGFEEQFAERVRECIQTHRFRTGNTPKSIEAKILFDADKVDVAGAIGIARTLVYKGQVTEPLYSLMPDGMVSDGGNDREPSFFQEYKYKLEHLYEHFYTKQGFLLAKERQQTAVDFYNSLLSEVSETYQTGIKLLERFFDIVQENPSIL